MTSRYNNGVKTDFSHRASTRILTRILTFLEDVEEPQISTSIHNAISPNNMKIMDAINWLENYNLIKKVDTGGCQKYTVTNKNDEIIKMIEDIEQEIQKNITKKNQSNFERLEREIRRIKEKIRKLR